MKNEFLLLAALLVFSSSTAFAQTPAAKSPSKKDSVISGEFSLQTAAKKKDPYTAGESAAIESLEGLKTKIPQLASGNISSLNNIDPQGLHFLTGAYLYCTVQEGICPKILDSMLELDIINARISHSEECPNLRQFWKTYIDNDMENRHRYMTKIGFLSTTSDFNTKTRPKYIKCKDTIKTELANPASNAEYFKARYNDPTKLAAVTKSLDMINQLKAKNANVFTEVGAGH